MLHHRRFAHQVQQMDFDALHVHVRYCGHCIQHHFMSFLRQAVNNVRADANAMAPKLLHGVGVALRIMCPVNQLRGRVMNGLQPHLDPEIGPLIQLGQVFDHIIREAVGTRSDGQADYARLLQNNFIIFSQLLDWSIRVRISLKVTDIFGIRPFQMLPVPYIIELGDQIVAAAAGEIPGASGAAEGAASFGDGAVAVGAGKSGIKHHLEHLGVHVLTHFIIPGMETFIPPQQRRGGL
ncbi:hypothetical protein D3C75_644520 [compost metagenome]